MIKIYERGSKEYKALEAAAALMSALDPKTDYYVQTVYFDLGQDWMWTTVCADSGTTYQALCPRDHELITDVGNLDAITQAVRQALKGV